MRITLIFCLYVLLFGCGEKKSLPTCEFSYFNHKKVQFPKNFEDNINVKKAHEIVDGRGNVVKCKIKHVESGIIDSTWYEIITIYYPEKLALLKFGDNENNLLAYSAFGGIKKNKNYCFGYAKSGEVQMVLNEVKSINVVLDFKGKENLKRFCNKQFGEVLLYKSNNR